MFLPQMRQRRRVSNRFVKKSMILARMSKHCRTVCTPQNWSTWDLLLRLPVSAKSFRTNNVEVDSHIDNIPKELSRDTSLCLFRVLQESLQNAVKYSGTRRFEVRLGCTANEIHLSVGDSGIGFDPQSAMNRHGLGLISMMERLKLVDGRLSIESRPQCGTTIHARVPLNAKVKSAVA
jgi:signal transduction histidine kinase